MSLWNANLKSSPSRTYVAMCNKGDFSGFYFKTFTLPLVDANGHTVENTPASASWWFLNVLDFIACIEGVVTVEDFHDVRPVAK